jgi:hypothetical protein
MNAIDTDHHFVAPEVIQTLQGGRHRSYMKAARGGLERAYSPPTLRPAPF